MLVRFFDIISRWVVRIAVFLIVLVALYVSLGRYYAPLIEQHTEFVVEQINAVSPYQIDAARLGGMWKRFSPSLHIRQLSILDENKNPSLVIPDVHMALDVVASVRSRALRLDVLRLRGAELSLHQQDDGRWRLAGFDTRTELNRSADGLIDLLLAINRLEVTDTRLNLQFRDGRQFIMPALNIVLVNSDDFHRLTITSGDTAQHNSTLLVVEAQGDPRDTELSAHAYGKFNEMDLAVFASSLPLEIEVRQFQLNGELWASIAPGKGLELQGKLISADVDLRRKTGDLIWGANSLSGELFVQRDIEGKWQGWLPPLTAQKNVPVGATSFQLAKQDEGHLLQLYSEGLSLAPLVQITLASGVLSQNLAEVVDQLDLNGDLQNIRLNLPLGRLPKQHFQLNAELNDVSLSAWKGAPGAKQLNGALQVGIDKGFLDIDASALALHFPKVYEHWLEFERAKAQVSWQIDEQRLQIESGPIELIPKGSGEVAQGLLWLDLPLQKNTFLPWMTLQVGLQNSKAEYREKYLPHFLKDGLKNWLKTSIGAGEVPRAGFIYHGPLRRSDDKPSVQLFVDVESAQLKYHADWPALFDISALLEIDDAVVDIVIPSAHMYTSEVEYANVHIESHRQGELDLKIAGLVSGSSADGLRVIKDSPIKQKLGDFIDAWQVAGAIQTNVDLMIPLEKESKRKPDVDVKVLLTDSSLSLPQQNVMFEGINGPLEYGTKIGLQSDALTATLWQMPVRIGIESTLKESAKESAWRTEIACEGTVLMDQLMSWSRQPGLTFLDGETAFSARIVIDPLQSNYLYVTSQLDGVTIDLPEPYKKQREEHRALRFQQSLESRSRQTKLQLAEQLQMSFLYQGDKFYSGRVHLGKSQEMPKAFDSEMISVTGQMGNFVLKDWLPVLDRYLDQQALWQGENKRTEQAPDLRVQALKLDRLQAFGRQVEKTVVDLHHEDNFWRIHLDNDALKGDIDIFDHVRPYRVAMDYLHVSALEAVPLSSQMLSQTDQMSGAIPVTPVSDEQFHPRDIPPVDVMLNKVYLGQEDFGRWSFQLRPLGQGVRARLLLADIKGMHIRGIHQDGAELDWVRKSVSEDADKKQDISYFKGRIQAGNIGDTLENWGYERMMQSDSSIFDIEANWPGNPFDVALEEISGDMNLSLREGSFIKASNTASGALKVVSFLNLDRIVRRLRLDFSDLAADGLGYDRISGRVKMNLGILTTDDEIEVVGSSSTFRIGGTVDFKQETLNGKMIVTLPLASNLPWIAAAVAGGLPAAAGVYVASKMLKKQVDTLSSAAYRIRGAWDDPELKFEQLFDTEAEVDDAQANKVTEGGG